MRIDPAGIALLLVLAIIPASGTMADEKVPESEAPVGQVQEQNPQPRTKPAAPSTTFTPTEKIKADSSVSFPVDI